MRKAKSYNDLVAQIATEVRELADQPINVLRSNAGGYGTDSRAEAIRAAKRLSRGQCIEAIITEEFNREFDCGFDD